MRAVARGASLCECSTLGVHVDRLLQSGTDIKHLPLQAPSSSILVRPLISLPCSWLFSINSFFFGTKPPHTLETQSPCEALKVTGSYHPSRLERLGWGYPRHLPRKCSSEPRQALRHGEGFLYHSCEAIHLQIDL